MADREFKPPGPRDRSKYFKDRDKQSRDLQEVVAQLSDADGVLDLVRMGTQSIPLREWMAENFIPMANVTQLSGDGGLGKSLLMLQLLVSSAMGLPWIGIPVKQTRCLGVFCEDDHEELHRRLYDVCVGYNIQIDDLAENCTILTRTGEANELMTFSRWGEEPPTESHLYKKIYSTVMSQGIGLIVLDSSHDLFIGNENDRTQVRQFVGALRKLCLATGAALILNSHPSMTGMQSGSGTAGSTAWHNSVRSRLYLTEPSGQTDARFRTLTNKKSNYGVRGSELAIMWENGVFVPTDQLGTSATARQSLQTGEALMLIVDKITALCERGVYPSPHDNHPKLFVAKLLEKEPELHGFKRDDLISLVQQGIREKRLGTATVPRSRKGLFRTAVVPFGFQIPTQADIDFSAVRPAHEHPAHKQTPAGEEPPPVYDDPPERDPGDVYTPGDYED